MKRAFDYIFITVILVAFVYFLSHALGSYYGETIGSTPQWMLDLIHGGHI